MNKLLYLAFPGAWWLLSKDSPLWGTLVFALLSGLGFYLYYQYLKRVQLIEARKRIEPVFVVSLNPDTKEEVILPDHLDKLCVHVKHENVMKTVEQWKRLLEESGNEFMEQDGENRLPVVPILFRDGRNVNEEWADFDERAVIIIKEVRAQWHERMSEANKDWYLRNHHKQSSYEWDVRRKQ